jgi:hypothetical protein
MKQLCFFALLLLTLVAHAQGTDKVQVSINKKTVVARFTPGVSQPGTVTLMPAQIKTSTLLVVSYSTTPQTGWKRQLQLIDSLGNEVLQFEQNKMSGTFSWNINGLAALLKKHGVLQLHTMALPTDPKQAALVRVARYELCTLRLK